MKANRGTVWINAGLLLIAAALFLSAYNERESHEARDSARQVIAQLCDALPTEAGDDEAEPTTLPESLPDVQREMPVKTINGRDYLLEYALPVDVALLRAHQADEAGNLRFRRSQRNFNPLMAMAAARTVAQVSRAVEPGGIDPEQVITPGIFVQGIVEVPSPAQEEALNRADAQYPEVTE